MHVSKISQFWDFITQPTHLQKNTTNIVFFSFVLGTALLTGSLISVFTIASIFWPLLWFVNGRYEVYIPKAIWAVAAVFFAFFLVEAILGLAFGGKKVYSEIIENITFLAILPLWVVIVGAPRDLINSVSLVAALASIIGLLCASVYVFWGAYQYGFWYMSVYRPELMTGNANVMALVSALSLAAILIGFSNSISKKRFAILSTGTAASIVLILASGSRAMLPATLLLPFIYFIILRPKFTLPSKKMFLALVVILSTLSIPAVNLVNQRIEYTISELNGSSNDNVDSSFGQRWMLWRIAYDIFRENPLVGVGPGNARHALIQKSRELTGQNISFTHFHNMFATAAVRGGLIELAALLGMFLIPLIVATKGIKNGLQSDKAFLVFLISLQIVYLLSGSTGLAIGQDIHDTLFVTGTVFALYGIYSRPTV
jgi:O-antigen ligase